MSKIGNYQVKFIQAKGYTKGRYGIKPDMIVIHNTGSEAPAKNNQNYFKNTDRASAHYIIDGTDPIIYQSVKKGDTAWAVGGYTQRYKNGNSRSISIEVVNNGGHKFTSDEIKQLKVLVKYLMKKYNIKAENVKRHYDMHIPPNAKSCPNYYVKHSDDWKKLHKEITKGIKETNVSKEQAKEIKEPVKKETQKKVKYYNAKRKKVIKSASKLGSFKKRETIAKNNGIKGYLGTIFQNEKLVKLYNTGKLKK